MKGQIVAGMYKVFKKCLIASFLTRIPVDCTCYRPTKSGAPLGLLSTQLIRLPAARTHVLCTEYRGHAVALRANYKDVLDNFSVTFFLSFPVHLATHERLTKSTSGGKNH